MQSTFIDNAKVMSKGQITIPKDVRTALGISLGDRVTFIVEDGRVQMVNSAVYAMQMLQSKVRETLPPTERETEEEISDILQEMRADGADE